MKGYLIDGWVVFKSHPVAPYYGYWVARKGDQEFTRRTLNGIRHEIAAHRQEEE